MNESDPSFQERFLRRLERAYSEISRQWQYDSGASRRCDWRQIVVVPDRRLAQGLEKYEGYAHHDAESDADAVRCVVAHRNLRYSWPRAPSTPHKVRAVISDRERPDCKHGPACRKIKEAGTLASKSNTQRDKRAPEAEAAGAEFGLVQKMGRPIVHGRSARVQVSGCGDLSAVTAHREANCGHVRLICHSKGKSGHTTSQRL